jgi:hypothetical protein
MIQTIIGVSGPAGAGKSVFCRLASDFFGYCHLEMADPLRQIAEIFRSDYGHGSEQDYADLHLALVNAKYNLKLSEPIIGLNKILQMIDRVEHDFIQKGHSVHDREFLQFLGTEVMRDIFGADVHCNAVWDNLLHDYPLADKYVIGSIRFQNEFEFWKAKTQRYHHILINRKTGKQYNHVSESWYKTFSGPQTIINNNGTMAEFITHCAYVLQNLNQE